ncbi:LysR family transcriptional regulator [Citrobacter sp. JGM124]|uniref:LysR family transcriptional regulator n=1 Tax=Citrobacter sp. JGM124 TaxID=2799789 RepID=UPI001BA604A4|nr:LysR family transcriptional regulator [Citrobacter sp. JGM124]MBS0847992.1 LysR family transcriptional regulator [Citrobacter sp. JGM124]
MNHSSLEIFIVVAEELSVIKAAQRLGRVQSNVTTRIQQLEEELDVQLFIRENRRLRLSPQGKKFLTYSKRILSLAEEARQSLHPGIPEGLLKLGSMESTVASRLSEPLTAFNLSCPAVTLRLCTGPTQQLTEKVVNSELDAALVALPSDVNGKVQCPDSLEYHPLFNEKLLLILPPTMKSVQKIEDINEGQLATFIKGCTYREMATGLLGQMTGRGEKIQIQEVNSYHSMLACVASGSSMCVLPESVMMLLQLPAGLHIFPAGMVTTQLIWRKDFSSPAMDILLEKLQNTSNISA